jgi:hypothetical protein
MSRTLTVVLLQGLGPEQFFALLLDLTLQTCGDGVFFSFDFSNALQILRS